MAKSKSSKKLTVSNNYNNEENNNIISTIVNILIIYYLINLEHNYCDCIRDWRHNYIKYTAIFLILINLLLETHETSGILIIFQIIYVYAFYTYIRDLDNTKCECAVVKQEKLHKFLNVWRYLMVIFPISVFLIGMFYMISYMNKKNKNLVYNKNTKKYILKN